MDSATEDIYLQKVEEFVYDEDKIVTCTWLSITLDINVNDARQLLIRYVKDIRESKPNDLAVTYTLIGTKPDNGLGIVIAKEIELAEKKELFKSIEVEQLYSVQKSKDVDLNILSLIETFDRHNVREKPLLGSIIGNNCIRRKLKAEKIPQEKPAQNASKSNSIKITNNEGQKENIPKSELQNKTNNKQNLSSKAPSKIKNDTKATKPKQNGIMANFFSQAPLKANENGKGTNTTTQNGVAKDVIKDETKHIDKKTKKESPSEKIEVVESDDSDDVKLLKKESAKTTKKGKRQRKGNKNEQPAKKRKRIVETNNSDSDDIFGSDDEKIDEDMVQLSDDEPEPVYKPQPVLVPKNKKGKFKTSQYTDDEATKKEWVFLSASEDEDESEQKIPENNIKPVIAETKKRKNDEAKSPPKSHKAKGKGNKNPQNQQTLMSFFKKV